MINPVFADGFRSLAVFSGVQSNRTDQVMAVLQAGDQFGVFPVWAKEPALAGLAAPDGALVSLFVLVALRPADVSRGAGKEIEPVINDLKIELAGSVGVGLCPVAGKTITMGLAAIIGRERPITADFTAGNRPLRHMFGGLPVSLISHAGE